MQRDVGQQSLIPYRAGKMSVAPQGFANPAIMETRQERLGINGAWSPACFFACFAAFFSLGVSNGCFFASLLDFSCLDMSRYSEIL